MKNIILIILLFIAGCTTIKIPDEKPGEPRICYYYRYCIYATQKSKDKSICKTLMDECSKILTYEYCKDKDNFDNCWHILK